MQEREWADFLDVYYRPHLLVVHLDTPTDSTSGKKLLSRLRRLVEGVRSNADYAVRLEGREVNVAFESDNDTATVSERLRARMVRLGGDGWASVTVCDLASSRGSQAAPPRRKPRHSSTEQARAFGLEQDQPGPRF